MTPIGSTIPNPKTGIGSKRGQTQAPFASERSMRASEVRSPFAPVECLLVLSRFDKLKTLSPPKGLSKGFWLRATVLFPFLG